MNVSRDCERYEIWSPGKERAGRQFRMKTTIIAAVFLSLGLAGCGGATGNLLGKPEVNTQGLTSVADGFTMVELRPIVGPTPDVQQRLTRQLNELARANAIALFIPPSYQQLPTVQIVLTAVREANHLSVGFTSEVLSSTGQRIDRLRGEEVAAMADYASLGGSGKKVTVRKGDTLSSIAGRHGITVAELKRLNDLNTTVILVGQRLKIQTGVPRLSVWERVTDDQLVRVASKIMKSLAIVSGRLRVGGR